MNEQANLVTAGLGTLREILGEGFEVTTQAPVESSGPTPQIGVLIAIRDTSGGTYTNMWVDAHGRVTPAVVRRQVLPRLMLMRQLPSSVPLLLVAPWLSPQVRKELDRAGCDYLDLTGNVSIDLRHPRLRIKVEGAGRDPQPRTTGQRGLGGAKAGLLIRLLTDVAPPVSTAELRDASGLSGAYVSRTLDVLVDRGLIERTSRSIVHVEWMALLRERAAATNLLRANVVVGAVAPQGVPQTLERLSGSPDVIPEVSVTGSYAAAAVAPVAVGGQLMLYVPPDVHAADRIAHQLGLLPTGESPNVLLLRPPSPSVLFGRRFVNGAWHVAFSQLALDSLSGPGRMPAEGEAILSFMADHLDEWRFSSLARATANAHEPAAT